MNLDNDPSLRRSVAPAARADRRSRYWKYPQFILVGMDARAPGLGHGAAFFLQVGESFLVRYVKISLELINSILIILYL